MTFHTKPEIRYFARMGWLILMALCIAEAVFLTYIMVRDVQAFCLEDVFYLLVIIALPATTICLYFLAYHEKCFAKITLTDTQIIWRCAFRKTRRMNLADCRFVGVELEDSYNKIDYPFIYFTTTIYPKEYSHKINKVKNSDTFIKFWYTENLAAYLIENFPKEKTGGVQYYYGMQCRKRRRKK